MQRYKGAFIPCCMHLQTLGENLGYGSLVSQNIAYTASQRCHQISGARTPADAQGHPLIMNSLDINREPDSRFADGIDLDGKSADRVFGRRRKLAESILRTLNKRHDQSGTLDTPLPGKSADTTKDDDTGLAKQVYADNLAEMPLYCEDYDHNLYDCLDNFKEVRHRYPDLYTALYTSLDAIDSQIKYAISHEGLLEKIPREIIVYLHDQNLHALDFFIAIHRLFWNIKYNYYTTPEKAVDLFESFHYWLFKDPRAQKLAEDSRALDYTTFGTDPGNVIAIFEESERIRQGKGFPKNEYVCPLSEYVIIMAACELMELEHPGMLAGNDKPTLGIEAQCRLLEYMGVTKDIEYDLLREATSKGNAGPVIDVGSSVRKHSFKPAPMVATIIMALIAQRLNA